MLELASGPSSALVEFAARGRSVTAIDVSDAALRRLEQLAMRRDVLARLSLVHADLGAWRADGPNYALVVCRYFWDPAVFLEACRAVAPGGLILWEAPVAAGRSHVRASWCLAPGEPAALLPPDFHVLRADDLPQRNAHGMETARRMIARRELVRPKDRE
ncbi:class I SAM-dependent methyltransferase [Amycolatopsis sp. cmx-4-61]|uniref:class I SAM-dependent methyltransferase n=1 Tax=Amycolatopsis sp. cmx-4-61 TaxID=2790937 RepID=UPI00397D4A53